MSRTANMLLIAVLAGAVLSVVPQSAGTADAASCVKIYRIYYDSPGSDTGSNTSRNGEWIQLKNTCTSNKSLLNFKFRDAANHWYKFGSYTLKAGAYVKVHTGSGTNTTTDRYWGQAGYVWNNTSDTAYLYNASGTLIRTCAYTSSSGGSKYC